MNYFFIFLFLSLSTVLNAQSNMAPIIAYLLDSSKPLPSGAFNTYNSQTFASSTCTPLAVETPIGIFASPTGSPNGDGTKANPFDLATAISKDSIVQAGETLWLMEGTYTGTFTSFLRGQEGNPIEVRPYPGKRVILKSPALAKGQGDSSSGTLDIQAPWTNYYGLEIISDGLDRISDIKGSNPSDINIQGGVNVGTYYNSSNTKVINFIVHDTRGGLSSFSASTDSELYGNIIYNNGWTGTRDRGHGHAIYTQNKIGYKKLTNNIIFFGFGTGIHAYYTGSTSGSENKLQNYDVQDNVWFLTGASDPRSSQKKDNCLIGGVYKPVTNLLVKHNFGYSDTYRGLRFGYSEGVSGQDGLIIDNYFAEGFWVAGSWNTLGVQNSSLLNGFVGDSDTKITDLGGNTFSEPLPSSGKKVFVSKNLHDPRRARVIIYNYDNDDKVEVDLSSVLQIGEAYRIHSVYDLFSDPILGGVYNGDPISIPMGTVAPVQPTGINGIDPDEDDPKKKFGVFIITHAGCS